MKFILYSHWTCI